MRWKVTQDETQTFKPFSLTLTFETEDEFVYFHHQVMTLLNPKVTSDNLYGAIYCAGRNTTPAVTEGTFALPSKRT